MGIVTSALGQMRLKAGYATQPFAAQALGVTRGHIARLESGMSRPSADLVDRMASLYGVTPEAIRAAVATAERSYTRKRGKRVAFGA